MRKIEIEVAQDNVTHVATFERVRLASHGHAELGWATVEDCRFPAIVYPNKTARGYAVYTVSDWQAPASTFGDLNDAYDWASLILCGTGEFHNLSSRSSGNPLLLDAFRLPITAEEYDMLLDSGVHPHKVRVMCGERPARK